MNETFINPNTTVSFSGHRVLDKNFDKSKIENAVKRCIHQGYDTFLTGMAIGFDTECFRILLELKKSYNIKIISCIPCINQSERFNSKQKEEYEFLLSNADEKIFISNEYSLGCMQKRNKFMVNYSTVLIAYLRREGTGTSSTVKYAIKKGIKIIFV